MLWPCFVLFTRRFLVIAPNWGANVAFEGVYCLVEVEKCYIGYISLRPDNDYDKVWCRLFVGMFDPCQLYAKLLKYKQYVKISITIEAKPRPSNADKDEQRV